MLILGRLKDDLDKFWELWWQTVSNNNKKKKKKNNNNSCHSMTLATPQVKMTKIEEKIKFWAKIAKFRTKLTTFGSKKDILESLKLLRKQNGYSRVRPLQTKIMKTPLRVNCLQVFLKFCELQA